MSGAEGLAEEANASRLGASKGEHMANDYAAGWDALSGAIGAARGESSGSIDDMEHMTIDQRLKAAEVAALLSIAQELSALNPQNTKTRGKDGGWVNGWGTPIE